MIRCAMMCFVACNFQQTFLGPRHLQVGGRDAVPRLGHGALMLWCLGFARWSQLDVPVVKHPGPKKACLSLETWLSDIWILFGRFG